MSLDLTTLLALADDGATVPAISAQLNVSPGTVYTALRRHRPDRKRSPRSCTSDLVPKILGLLSRGVRPSRVAFLVGCSRQFVYKVAPGTYRKRKGAGT